MSRVVLVQASPSDATTGATVAVRLAGGGVYAYTQLGFTDWRAGVKAPPRFTAEIGFDAGGWNGAAIPQSSAITFASGDQALTGVLTRYYWNDAPITITIGDDEKPDAYVVAFVGKVARASTDLMTITLTLADLSVDLNKPLLTDTFAGTGGLEGVVDITGRVKRRSWGRVFNVEGQILDKANNVYEFGDPTKPLQQFVRIKDKGREGPMTVVAWAGSAAATLAALIASTPPAGGGSVAPSIACAKWWTVASGPLTADLLGEVGSGYVETVAAMFERIAQAKTSITVSNVAAMVTARSAPAGIHCAEAGETIANVLDRLALGASLLWVMDPTGFVTLREWTFTSNGTVVTGIGTIARRETYAPIKTRKLGYQANNRIHTDAEISAAINSTDVNYADGTPIEDLKPAQANADVTSANQHVLNTPPGVVVQADYLGNIASGQFPAVGSFRRYLGGADVSANTSYAIDLPPGITATMNDTPGSDQRGNVTITAATVATASIGVASLYGGVALYSSLQFTRQDAALPASGGGGGGGTGTPVATSPNAFPGTSGSNVALTPTLTVTVGSGGGVSLAYSFAYSAVTQGTVGDPGDAIYSSLGATWQTATSSSGPWTDVGTETVGTGAARFFSSTDPKGNQNIIGNISYAVSGTGYTPGTRYFRVVGRLADGTYAINSVTGSASATP